MTKTINQQTGWRRSSPAAICQDISVLLAITEFDYELHNREFENYCFSRFGFIRADDPKYFEQLCDIKISKDDFFDYWKVCGKYAHPNMKGKIKTNDSLETSWNIFNICRGKIQDCWEIYSRRR